MSWPTLGASRLAMYGASPATSYSTPLTAGLANTKGAWAALVAATEFAAAGLVLYLAPTLGATFTTRADYLVDIGIGAEGAEVVRIADLLVSTVSSTVSGGVNDFAFALHLPLALPAGVRLAARCQCSTAAKTLAVACQILGPAFWEPPLGGVIDTYGATAADSGGTGVDTGDTANVKGAWSQLAAATLRPIRSLALLLGSQQTNPTGSSGYQIDVAVGAEGSEQVVMGDLPAARNVTYDLLLPPVLGPYDTNIPAGSRLAVRAACSATEAPARNFDVVLLGVS